MEITCKICGAKEETSNWIEKCSKELTERQLCFTCNHWHNQLHYDNNEREEHEWAVINGVHYVLLPHTNLNWPVGMGGRKFSIRFNDGFETECDNLWCQGNIPKGFWRDYIFPDNAQFLNDYEKINPYYLG